MFKRTLCLLCCVALVILTPFAAAAAEFRMAGFDGDDSNHTWKDNAFFTRMQERTGISFTFDEYTNFSKWQAAKEAMFATGELPDVLFKAELTTREQIEYARSGQLIDLAPLLAQQAPNLWALLQANPEWKKAVTLPDGKIVALPAINRVPAQNAMWINRTWLDALKLEAPTDLDSLVTVLRAFHTGDPNGNGTADEIPLSFLGPWDLKFLAHAVGLAANDYNVYLSADGVVRFMPEEDAYLELLRTLSDLYAEGLLDANGFTTADTFRTVTDSDAAAKYGVFFGPNPMNLLPFKTSEQYELLEPLSYGGKQIYRDLYGQIMQGTFAITSACDDPAALLGWVDALYTPEGAIEAMAGKKGADYALDSDGRWSYAAESGESPDTSALNNLSIYDTGNMPWLFPLDFYNRYNNDSIARISGELEKLQTLVVTPYPNCTLTPEQEDTVLPMQNKLGRYVDESLARFVTGEWDAHSEEAIAAYRAGLDANGKREFVAFWQGIADGLPK